MKCSLHNLCEKKYLCCRFCYDKKCPDRCKDDHSNCKFFNKVKCDVNDQDDLRTPPKR